MKPSEAPPRYRILIIDDNLAIHEDFQKILITRPETDTALEDMESILFEDAPSEEKNGFQFEIQCASKGEEGLEMVRMANAEERPFSVAFVDDRMPPGWDGVETIGHLWKESPELQAVLCTAYADYSWQEIQQSLGDNDSLLILKKPFDNVEVLQMAHALSRKYELNREIKGKLKKLAFYDHLTGLPNRALFLDRLKHTLAYHLRYPRQGALLFIDLDNFKRINDTLGHSVGDELLKIMAGRLLASLRASDTVSHAVRTGTTARLGGDEFTVLLTEIGEPEKAATVSQRIIDDIKKPIIIGKNELTVTPSIGIAIFPDDGENVETVMKNADLAMSFAKKSARGNFKYYQASMNAEALKRLTIENKLRQAIGRKELHLYYQPQVALPSGRLIGLEALLRWDNQELGRITPEEFIPIAEESGLIIPIGEWVLRTACGQGQAWIAKGLPIQRIAVNVSVKQLTHPDFVKMLEGILKQTRMPPDRLEVEITESVFTQNMDYISNILKILRSKKIHIAIDDFGTGYSNLSRLKNMPISCLKIDRSFVWGINTGITDQAIIGAVMVMAKGMGLRVIAEGVENEKQSQFLSKKDCREAQGFFFSRPLPAEEVDILFKEGRLRTKMPSRSKIS